MDLLSHGARDGAALLLDRLWLEALALVRRQPLGHRLLADGERVVHPLARVGVGVALLPARLAHLDRPVADVLARHVAQRLRHVPRVLEGDEAVALRLPAILVAHHPRPLEGRVLLERVREHVVVRLVAEVAHKDPKVVLGPIGERLVGPHAPRRAALRRLPLQRVMAAVDSTWRQP